LIEVRGVVDGKNLIEHAELRFTLFFGFLCLEAAVLHLRDQIHEIERIGGIGPLDEFLHLELVLPLVTHLQLGIAS